MLLSGLTKVTYSIELSWTTNCDYLYAVPRADLNLVATKPSLAQRISLCIIQIKAGHVLGAIVCVGALYTELSLSLFYIGIL